MKSHFKGQYTCKHCGKLFTEIGNRNRHERNVHTTQQFDCITCGKQFKLLKSLKAHIQKKHSAEKDSDSGGAAEAPVGAAVPSTLESQQEVEDLDKTIDAVESDMEEVEVCLTDHLDVLNNSAWVSNEVTLSSAGAEKEAPDREELVSPENMDMEDQSEATTAVTIGSSGGAEDEEEAPDVGELLPPETRDMEDKTEATTAVMDFSFYCVIDGSLHP